MNELTAEERLNKYAKESKNIEYSTKIFEATTEEREKPKIVLRELKKEEDRVWTIILKYKTLGNILQEVIMGTLGDTNERKKKAVEIINLIRGQLEENVTSETGYKHYEKLSQYVQSENIPFRLTMEGADILSSKSKENIEIKRTCKENRQGKIEELFDKEEIKQMKEGKNSELNEYIKQQRSVQKWEERREKILNSFDTDEKRQTFLKGEKITEFLKEADEDAETQKNIVADYLLEAYDDENKDEKENPRLNLLKGYLKIKEKGLAIDVKKSLEDLENKYYKAIKEKKGEISEDDYSKLEVIDDYKTFFDLVKTGKDWNARLFALKLKKIDFNGLRKIFEAIRSEDKELLKYFTIKERMINDVKTDNIEVDYNQYDSVKELYEFLLHSSVREETKEDDERVISSIYEHVKREIIASNIDEMEIYNHYAEKSDISVYALPKNKEKARQMPISNITIKICNDINDTVDLENNQEEKNVQEEAEK